MLMHVTPRNVTFVRLSVRLEVTDCPESRIRAAHVEGKCPKNLKLNEGQTLLSLADAENWHQDFRG